MDKKTQKRVGILRQRIQKLQKVLACVKSQADEPDEIEKVEKELGDARLELETLLQS
ncbi:hypothetical protein [Aureliella helgolandensis]|uniref:Uncharacterized protein n=1 Tax=Aureliella helgolandensis TaxID=2527968 RepID=A0A518G034_9BACT|nr:hypothetical protein [Aureliella helgolandensis]QDV21972.1 hypothetical protein Q31a_02510 [Aureliella helgolandensis]